MKNFFILFKLNIKDLWQNSRLIFLLIISFMVLSFSFIPLGFNAMNYIQFSGGGNFLGKTFSFKLNSTQNLKENLDKYISETKDIQCVFFSFECENLIENNTATIYALYEGDFRTDTNVSYGNWFSSNDLNNGEKVIVVPFYTFEKKSTPWKDVPKYDLGSKFDINGEEYTVIGESSIIKHIFFIPYNSIENKDTFVNLHIAIKDSLTESKTIKFAQNVTKYFDCEVAGFAEIRSPLVENFLKIFYTLILSVGIINLIFIYSYLLSQRKTLIGLFKTYGMKKSKCILYLLCEFLLWLLGCFLVSSVIVNLFLLVAVKVFNVSFLYRFSFMENLSFLAFYLVLYFICFVPTIIKCVVKNNELDLINGSQEE